MGALNSFGWITYDIAIFFHQFTHAGHSHKIVVSKARQSQIFKP